MAGLYVHVPFCRSKCAYCDFYSMPRLDLAERFANALEREYELRKGECGEDFTTFYLGGGTPSSLPPQVLERIRGFLPEDGLTESTIEANPEDADYESALRWRALGFDRVSMGVQSFADSELAIIGRRHTAARALEAVDNIRRAGFSNFSLDLIYGLPGQTLESWDESLSTLLSLRPTHFSSYMLSYEPRTRLTAMLRAGKVQEASEDMIADMYALLCQKAREAGYAHYEISNFALPGFEAKHNSSYWRGTPYLGLGPSAHSFDGAVRRANRPSLKDYIDSLEQGVTAYDVEDEDDASRFNDLVMTSLRTSAGLDLRQVPQPRMEELRREAAPFLRSGLLVEADGRLIIPEDKWLVSDYTISSLMQD